MFNSFFNPKVLELVRGFLRADLKTQGKFEQLSLKLCELNHAQPQRQEIATALLTAASAMVFHINISFPSKQLLEFLHKRRGMGKEKKRGLYVLCFVELFFSLA